MKWFLVKETVEQLVYYSFDEEDVGSGNGSVPAAAILDAIDAGKFAGKVVGEVRRPHHSEVVEAVPGHTAPTAPSDSTCPCCGASDIMGDPGTFGDNGAMQEMFCNSCEASWDNIYTLEGNENISPAGAGE